MMVCTSNILVKPNLMAKHHQTQNGTIIRVQNFRYPPQQYSSDDTKITGRTNKMLLQDNQSFPNSFKQMLDACLNILWGMLDEQILRSIWR